MLLILAGVSISTFTGQESILDNTKNAVGKYNNSVIREQEMLNEISEYIKNDGNVEEANGITISVVPDTTGVAKIVTVTIAAISEDGIKNLTSNAGINKTYGEGTKEILETCEITENGIYTFTVESNKGQKASKGILIGNILKGTIQMTVDKTMPTKDNVKVTVIWPEGSENGIKEIKIGTNSWQSETGNISEVDVTDNCTVEARVRNNNEEVISSSITISNIDKNNPIVTATTGTEIMEEGTSNEISKYFTYSSNGTADISSVTYTDTSNGDAVVTNTNTLSIGTHFIKCTVTKETGLSTSATKTIVIEKGALVPASNYGAYVTNYTTPSGDPNVRWRIFYADESNVYLIADNYVRDNYVPKIERSGINDFDVKLSDVYEDYTGAIDITNEWIEYVKDYPNSTYNNIRAVAFILDEKIWSEKYANSKYAEYAIGGPTLELYSASYKRTHPNKYIQYSYGELGYSFKWSTSNDNYTSWLEGIDTKDNLYVVNYPNMQDGMWLASPAANSENVLCVFFVDDETGSGLEGVFDAFHTIMYNQTGFRPIVCLKSETKLEKISDTEYRIIE